MVTPMSVHGYTPHMIGPLQINHKYRPNNLISQALFGKFFGCLYKILLYLTVEVIEKIFESERFLGVLGVVY